MDMNQIVGKRVSDFLEDLTKTFTKEKEPETITAFMGEVSTDKAKKGIKKVEKIMDMIVFHKQTNDSFEDMMF